MMEAQITSESYEGFLSTVRGHIQDGARLAGLMASVSGPATELVAIFSLRGSLKRESTLIPSGVVECQSLSSYTPSSRWYEREISDLFGISFVGRCSNEPLVLPLAPGSRRPRPGLAGIVSSVTLDQTAPDMGIHGEGIFTISYGPVRSGVFESVEYLVETPGEDIPSLSLRLSYKHRGIEKAFEGLRADEGVPLIERFEGVATVAHALAFCGALEQIAGVEVPAQAGFVRVVHAELERIANHLDTMVRHVEAAGQAVAYSRLSYHKERVQRLRARLCGSRFGRGVIVVGGVAGQLGMGFMQLLSEINNLQAGLNADLKLLMGTPSFLDRLRGTGVVPASLIREYGALGPLARGSGVLEDVRFARPYAAYGRLGHGLIDVDGEGDALARQRVRLQEIDGAFGLIRRAVEELNEVGEPESGRWSVPMSDLTGEALGWAEAPQGEIVTWVRVHEGVLTRVKPRSASFHNLALFPLAFPKDILTDFAFIEASFGLSIAGVAG